MKAKKRILLTLILAAPAFLTLSAQDRLAVIRGTISKVYAKEAVLYKVVEGERVQFASQQLNDKQEFAFAVPNPAPGYYYLVGRRDGAEIDAVRLFLQGGEQLNYKISDEDISLSTASVENKLLFQWQQLARVITNPARLGDTSTYQSFFPKLEAFLPQADAFKEKIHTANKPFNALLRYTVDHDVEHAALSFILTPRTIHPTVNQYPPYYHNIILPKKFCTARVLQFGDGYSSMEMYATFSYLMRMAGDKSFKPDRDNLFRNNLESFCNDTVKGVYIAHNLENFKSYETLSQAITPVKKFLVTAIQKQRYLDYEKSVRTFEKGSPAYKFSYSDINGKTVSLDDLKGKVVVVDMWATWCGPCLQQLPYLDTLETAMKGDNVAFVSISIDEKKDVDKWKKMVAEKEMQGYQLIAPSWDNEMIKYYSIKGIPRFMVFDQKGNIVTVDAPRPSSPELKALIEKTLKEG